MIVDALLGAVLFFLVVFVVPGAYSIGYGNGFNRCAEIDDAFDSVLHPERKREREASDARTARV